MRTFQYLGNIPTNRIPRPASLARPPARHSQGGGLPYAVLRAAFASARHFSATAALRSLKFILHFVRMWICYVRCLRLCLPPVKHSPSARRPRSRLGNPARLRRSAGRHRFRQSSSPPVQARQSAATFPVSPPPAFIHARRTAHPTSFCPIYRRQPARLPSSPIRITPRRSLI